jgi:hypothetical protein
MDKMKMLLFSIGRNKMIKKIVLVGILVSLLAFNAFATTNETLNSLVSTLGKPLPKAVERNSIRINASRSTTSNELDFDVEYNKVVEAAINYVTIDIEEAEAIKNDFINCLEKNGFHFQRDESDKTQKILDESSPESNYQFYAFKKNNVFAIVVMQEESLFNIEFRVRLV